MADRFADLTKQERIKLAVEACKKERRLTAKKVAKIYQITPSTITQCFNDESKPKQISAQTQQLLTPVEEQIIVRWGKNDADKLRADMAAKEAEEIARKIVIGLRKKEQERKRAQKEAEKIERAVRRAEVRDIRDLNAKMVQLGKIQQS